MNKTRMRYFEQEDILHLAVAEGPERVDGRGNSERQQISAGYGVGVHSGKNPSATRSTACLKEVENRYYIDSEGLELYENRLDTGYSLTDCISMSLMSEREIQEVLTHDNHFKQEGFTSLL